MSTSDQTLKIEDNGVVVELSNPTKVLFPAQGWTKLDLVRHYLGCGPGALRGVLGRPTLLKRWPHGVGERPFFQKRAPKSAQREPAEHSYATVRFPSGRTADLLVPRRLSDIVWMAQLDCIDLNPWPVRDTDLDHPDELRIDLDPEPGTPFSQVREVALACRDVLEEHGLMGWPKTSGSRGIHIYVRIEPHWDFTEVRRAALALGREVERRLPAHATTAWWKEERRGVFIDYNQNARDRTMASAYSVRQTGFVSAPLRWDEVPVASIQDYPMDRFVLDRYSLVGDLTEGIDAAVGRLDGLLDLARKDQEEGLGEAPWPPHFPKAPGEPRRVQPSRRGADGRRRRGV
jgi:bifunctional non-homologous end joining protein LigD